MKIKGYILFFILLALSSYRAGGFSPAASDSLFAAGVRLYENGEFARAITLFEKCHYMDAEDPSVPENRKDYARMWIASCYFMSGDTANAAITYEYYDAKPVDRRLTVRSDSLFDIGTELCNSQEYEKALPFLLSAAQIEEKATGPDHFWYGNTLIALLDCMQRANPAGCGSIVEKLFPVFVNNERWAGPNMTYLINTVAIVDSASRRLLMSFAHDYLRCEAFAPFDRFYSELVSLEALLMDDLSGAVALLEKTRSELQNPFPVYNQNRYQLLSNLAILYTYGTLNPNQESMQAPPPLQFTRNVLPVYDELEEVLEKLLGKDSYPWMEIQMMRAHYYATKEPDMEKAKSFIVRPCEDDSIPHSFIYEENLKSYLRNAYQIFDYIGQAGEYIEYVSEFIDIENDIVDYNDLLWKNLAEAYGALRQYDKEAELYGKIAASAAEHGDKLSLAYILDYKAGAEKLARNHTQAIADYKEVARLKKNEEKISYSSMGQLYSSMLTCYNDYFGIADSVQYEVCRAEALKYYELAVATGDNNSETYTFDNKIHDIYEIVSLKESSYGLSRDWAAATGELKKLAAMVKTSSLAENYKKYQLSGVYLNLGRRYIALYDFNDAYACLDSAMSYIDDTLGYRYPAILSEFGDLYSIVSVEPELSLDYYFRAALVSEKRVLERSNSLSETELVTERESLMRMWEKCAENYRYLGYFDRALESMEHLLEIAGIQYGRKSERYRYYARQMWESEAESFGHGYINIAPPRSQMIKFEENTNIDLERAAYALAKLDSMDRDYAMTPENLYYRGLAYGNRLKDTVAAKKHIRKALELLEANLQDSCQANSIYENCVRYLYDNDDERLLEFYRNKAAFLAAAGDTLEMADSFYNMAALFRRLDSPDSAKIFYRKAFEAAERRDKEYADGLLYSFARYLFEIRDYAGIAPYYGRVTDYTKGSILWHFKEQTNSEREESWFSEGLFPFYAGEMLALKYDPEGAIPDTLLYNNLLFRKNILMNTSISAANLIKSSGDTLMIQKNERMNRLESKLGNGDTVIFDNGRKYTAVQVEKLINRFENEILARSLLLYDITEGLVTEWRDVQAALPDSSLAVEFTRYGIPGEEEMYGAVIMTRRKNPEFIPLCTARELEGILKKDYYNTGELASLLWRPLFEAAPNAKKVYFSADGELNNYPVEYIPDYTGTGLVSDNREIYRLSSTRELTLHRDTAAVNSAVLYGGLLYNSDESSMLAEQEKYGISYRDFDYATRDTYLPALRNGVGELPATKEEVMIIDSTLAKAEIPDKLYIGILGTEASFKALSGAKTDLLHVATHGFYWTEDEANMMKQYSFLNSISNSSEEDLALARSGLLLAGANNVLTGKSIPEGVDDGVLTAREVSALDLRGLDLVVLSACQTGLGEITGDGVLGLQRGFKKAGAKTLLMSLWKVDDNATRMLMTGFYSNLVAGMSKTEALSAAQRHLREYEATITVKSNGNLTPSQIRRLKMQGKSVGQQTEVKRVKPYSHPKYWSAFILLDAVE